MKEFTFIVTGVEWVAGERHQMQNVSRPNQIRFALENIDGPNNWESGMKITLFEDDERADFLKDAALNKAQIKATLKIDMG